MDDADAKQALLRTMVDKIREPRFGLGNRHAVQIDLGLNTEPTARKFAHCAAADRLPMKVHAVGITVLHRIDVGLETLTEGLFLIGTCKPRSRSWLVLWFGDALPGAQRFGSGHRAAENVCVIIAQGGVLRLWCAVNIEYSERVASRQSSESHCPYENPR